MSDPVYSVLVIDRDVGVSDDFGRALLGLPVAVLRAGDPVEGMKFYLDFLPQMVLLDAGLDDGEVSLHDMFAGDSALEIVLMTDHWTPTAALDAVRRGASDLLTKPLDPVKVRQLVSILIA